MKDEQKMSEKTSLKNFYRAIQLGLQGYIHLTKICDNFYLTTDVCRENGRLGGMPIMQPCAFVRMLPETGLAYLITIAKGKAYSLPDDVEFYTPETAFIFKVLKGVAGKPILVECNQKETFKVIEYMDNNNYWKQEPKENSR